RISALFLVGYWCNWSFKMGRYVSDTGTMGLIFVIDICGVVELSSSMPIAQFGRSAVQSRIVDAANAIYALLFRLCASGEFIVSDERCEFKILICPSCRNSTLEIILIQRRVGS